MTVTAKAPENFVLQNKEVLEINDIVWDIMPSDISFYSDNALKEDVFLRSRGACVFRSKHSQSKVILTFPIPILNGDSSIYSEEENQLWTNGLKLISQLSNFPFCFVKSARVYSYLGVSFKTPGTYLMFGIEEFKIVEDLRVPGVMFLEVSLLFNNHMSLVKDFKFYTELNNMNYGDKNDLSSTSDLLLNPEKPTLFSIYQDKYFGNYSDKLSRFLSSLGNSQRDSNFTIASSKPSVQIKVPYITAGDSTIILNNNNEIVYEMGDPQESQLMDQVTFKMFDKNEIHENVMNGAALQDFEGNPVDAERLIKTRASSLKDWKVYYLEDKFMFDSEINAIQSIQIVKQNSFAKHFIGSNQHPYLQFMGRIPARISVTTAYNTKGSYEQNMISSMSLFRTMQNTVNNNSILYPAANAYNFLKINSIGTILLNVEEFVPASATVDSSADSSNVDIVTCSFVENSLNKAVDESKIKMGREILTNEASTNEIETIKKYLGYFGIYLRNKQQGDDDFHRKILADLVELKQGILAEFNGGKVVNNDLISKTKEGSDVNLLKEETKQQSKKLAEAEQLGNPGDSGLSTPTGDNGSYAEDVKVSAASVEGAKILAGQQPKTYEAIVKNLKKLYDLTSDLPQLLDKRMAMDAYRKSPTNPKTGEKIAPMPDGDISYEVAKSTKDVKASTDNKDASFQTDKITAAELYRGTAKVTGMITKISMAISEAPKRIKSMEMFDITSSQGEKNLSTMNDAFLNNMLGTAQNDLNLDLVAIDERLRQNLDPFYFLQMDPILNKVDFSQAMALIQNDITERLKSSVTRVVSDSYQGPDAGIQEILSKFPEMKEHRYIPEEASDRLVAKTATSILNPGGDISYEKGEHYDLNGIRITGEQGYYDSKANTVYLTNLDVVRLVKLVSTEVRPGTGKMIEAVTEAVLNRLVLGNYGKTIGEIANAPWQFSAIRQDKALGVTHTAVGGYTVWGSVDKVPTKNAQKVATEVIGYLTRRNQGQPTFIKGAPDYANPYATTQKMGSSAKTIAAVQAMWRTAQAEGLVFGQGNYIHAHGNQGGGKSPRARADYKIVLKETLGTSSTPSVKTTPNSPQIAPTGVVYIGDSIAYGYAKATKSSVKYCCISANPDLILSFIDGTVSDNTNIPNKQANENRKGSSFKVNPNDIKGKLVCLSTGLTNVSGTSIGLSQPKIKAQVQALKKMGAIVYLLPVVDNFPGWQYRHGVIENIAKELNVFYGEPQKNNPNNPGHPISYTSPVQILLYKNGSPAPEKANLAEAMTLTGQNQLKNYGVKLTSNPVPTKQSSSKPTDIAKGSKTSSKAVQKDTRVAISNKDYISNSEKILKVSPGQYQSAKSDTQPEPVEFKTSQYGPVYDLKPSDKAAAKGKLLVELLQVEDGDSIWVRDPSKKFVGGKPFGIRFVHVDTPETLHKNRKKADGSVLVEPAQYFGPEAKAFTEQNIAKSPFTITIYGVDVYGRVIASIPSKTAKTGDLNYQLIWEGYGVPSGSDKYAYNCMLDAKKNKRGMWANSDRVVPPSSYRDWTVAGGGNSSVANPKTTQVKLPVTNNDNPTLDNYTPNSPFGPRGGRIHKGQDFAGPLGGKVKAMADGIAYAKNNPGGYGTYVQIDHGNGFQTIYAHLSKRNIQDGQSVKYGDIIGEVGNTGKSTGPHLHYQVEYKGIPLNPFKTASLHTIPASNSINVAKYISADAFDIGGGARLRGSDAIVSQIISGQSAAASSMDSAVGEALKGYRLEEVDFTEYTEGNPSVFDKTLKLNKHIEKMFSSFDLGLNQCFPVIKAYLVVGNEDDETMTDGIPLLSASMFELPPVQEFRLSTNNDFNPIDVCTFSVLNPSFIRSIPDEMDASAWNSNTTQFSTEFIKIGLGDAIKLKAGMKVHIRAGYNNDPNKLKTIFNGSVKEIYGQDNDTMMHLVCASYATEMVNNTFGYNKPMDLAKNKNASTGLVFAYSLLSDTISHFGTQLGKARVLGAWLSSFFPVGYTSGDEFTDFKWWDGKKDNILAGKGRAGDFRDPENKALVAAINWGEVSWPWEILNPSRGNLSQRLFMNIYADAVQQVHDDFSSSLLRVLGGMIPGNGEKGLYGFYTYRSSTWSIAKEMEYRHPGTLVKPLWYDDHQTLFFGTKEQLYVARDLNPVFMLKCGEKARYSDINKPYVKEYLAERHKRLEPATGFHLLSTKFNILSNGMGMNRNFATRVNISYYDETYDANPTKEYDDSNVERMTIDENIRSYDIRETTIDFGGCNGQTTSWLYGTQELKKQAETMYSGQIVITGKPDVRAGDYAFIDDSERALSGIIKIRECEHIYSEQEGYITVITPGMHVECTQFVWDTLFIELGIAAKMVMMKADIIANELQTGNQITKDYHEYLRVIQSAQNHELSDYVIGVGGASVISVINAALAWRIGRGGGALVKSAAQLSFEFGKAGVVGGKNLVLDFAKSAAGKYPSSAELLKTTGRNIKQTWATGGLKNPKGMTGRGLNVLLKMMKIGIKLPIRLLTSGVAKGLLTGVFMAGRGIRSILLSNPLGWLLFALSEVVLAYAYNRYNKVKMTTNSILMFPISYLGKPYVSGISGFTSNSMLESMIQNLKENIKSLSKAQETFELKGQTTKSVATGTAIAVEKAALGITKAANNAPEAVSNGFTSVEKGLTESLDSINKFFSGTENIANRPGGL